MRTKSFLPFLILLCLLSSVTILNSTLFAKVSATLTINQLSDHDLTVPGSIQDSTSAATEDAAHLAWIEPVEESFGSPTDWDVFYRQMPTGTTINLSVLANAEGVPGSLFIQPGEENNVCLIWREQASNDEYYLYLWNSILNNVFRSPNPVDGNGQFIYMPFICSMQNDPLVVWYIEYANTEVTLWDLSSGQQQRISNNSDVPIQNLQIATVNDVSYFAWTESANVYLWDATSRMTKEIDNTGFAYELSMFSDKNNVVHLFWLSVNGVGPSCYFYWNNIDQINELFGPCDVDDWSVVKDGSGNVHVAWNETNIEHWNVTENITNTIPFSGGGFDKMNLIPGPDSKVHIFWQDFVTYDLYYWNSSDKAQTFVTTASFYIQNEQKWTFDSTGMIYTVLGDGPGAPNNGDISYWNPSLPISIKLTNAPIFFPIADITIDNSNKVHIVYGQQGQGSFLQYWNGDMGQPIIATPSHFWDFNGFTAANGDVFALFNSPNDLYYWSINDGEVFLGQGDNLSYVVDHQNNIYIHWIASEFGNDDMYAAWSIQATEFIYLPLIVSE